VAGRELEAGQLVGVVDQAQAAAGRGEQAGGVHRLAAQGAQLVFVVVFVVVFGFGLVREA
jgi:hypothetical protein